MKKRTRMKFETHRLANRTGTVHDSLKTDLSAAAVCNMIERAYIQCWLACEFWDGFGSVGVTYVCASTCVYASQCSNACDRSHPHIDCKSKTQRAPTKKEFKQRLCVSYCVFSLLHFMWLTRSLDQDIDFVAERVVCEWVLFCVASRNYVWFSSFLFRLGLRTLSLCFKSICVLMVVFLIASSSSRVFSFLHSTIIWSHDFNTFRLERKMNSMGER